MPRLLRSPVRLAAALCVLIALPPVAGRAQVASRAKFQPDLRMATVKKVVKEGVVRAGRYKGNDVYEKPATEKQTLILPGAAGETEIYLVMVQNDGTKDDEIRLLMEGPDESRNASFSAALFSTSGPKKKKVRGEDVTAEALGTKGIQMEIAAGKTKVFWLEITAGGNFVEGDTTSYTFLARSLGSKGSAPQALVAATSDSYVAQMGEAIPEGPVDEIDPSTITFWRAQVGGWKITSDLTDASGANGVQILRHTKAGKWPAKDVFTNDSAGPDKPLEANCWIVVKINGKWHAAPWEWLARGQTRKSVSNAGLVFPDHIKVAFFRGWKVRAGMLVGLFVTSRAIVAPAGINERSNIRLVIWK